MIKYEHRVWRLRLSWKQDEGLLSVFYKNKWIPIDRIPEEGWELVAFINNELTGDVDSKNKSKAPHPTGLYTCYSGNGSRWGVLGDFSRTDGTIGRSKPTVRTS